MTGLLLLLVAGFWLVVVGMITRGVISHFRPGAAKVAAGIATFAVLLVAPLFDEIIGARQFDALCKQYAVQIVDGERAMNRSVVYVRRPMDRYAEGTAVRIRIDPWVFKDADTGNVLVSYHTLEAQGGWLIRALGISETNSPLFFKRGCAPPDQFGFRKKFNIKVIN